MVSLIKSISKVTKQNQVCQKASKSPCFGVSSFLSDFYISSSLSPGKANFTMCRWTTESPAVLTEDQLSLGSAPRKLYSQCSFKLIFKNTKETFRRWPLRRLYLLVVLMTHNASPKITGVRRRSHYRVLYLRGLSSGPQTERELREAKNKQSYENNN